MWVPLCFLQPHLLLPLLLYVCRVAKLHTRVDRSEVLDMCEQCLREFRNDASGFLNALFEAYFDCILVLELVAFLAQVFAEAHWREGRGGGEGVEGGRKGTLIVGHFAMVRIEHLPP